MIMPLSLPRTPKAGEHWVWKECVKHRFHQLRDLVVVGVDFEDQPEFAQKIIMEHVLCGCQYPAADPEAALRDLRRDEAKYEDEMRAKLAAIMNPPPRSYGFDVPWLLIALLAGMATLMYMVLHR